MRTVTYGAACSLDGFITGRDGALDWLFMSRDVRQIMSAYWATIDTLVMGRKTWDVSTAQGGSGGLGGDITATYVFSRSLNHIASPGVHLISTDPGAFVNALKRRSGRGICVMGGGELAQALFAADAIDEVGLNIHPVLLGTGTPLFRDPGRPVPLQLAECRPIAGGCVLATYRVRHRQSRAHRAWRRAP